MEKNKYLKNLNKIEFVVTYACTGCCKHCSEGEHSAKGEYINPRIAAESVRRISAEYDIKTVMTFGGEPLLYAESVYEIMIAAKEMNIPKRQVITNGFFSKNETTIFQTAKRLGECGVNDLLLSVDAFHQETIPLDIVKFFALKLSECNVPVRLQPAWLVSRDDDNPYNIKTKEILKSFDFPIGEGNVIFPEGNAKKYLSQYFINGVPENPYVEDLSDVRCVSFSPNGDVLGGNVYKTNIMEIIKKYTP